MTRSFKRITASLAAGLGILLMAGPACAQGIQEFASYRGADRQQRLEQAAREEGSLTLYMNIPRVYSDRFVQPFEEKYGVKVNIWRARSELTLKRVIDEARAGRHAVDVVNSISPPMEALRREHLLESIDSPAHQQLKPHAVPKHREWVSMRELVFVQAYNTQSVKKDELPRSYQDLLARRWKGNVGIEAGDHEWMASVIEDMGTEKGRAFFRDLADNDLRLVTGHPVLANAVVSGEVPLGLTVYNYDALHWKGQNAPIDWFAIEPAITIQDGIAIAKNAPHPHAALLFYEYMLGGEAQAVLAEMNFMPTNVQVEPPLRDIELKVLDPADLLDDYAASEQQFQHLLIDRK